MDRWIVVLILGQFIFLAFIIAVVARAREARMRLRSEERSRLLERFSSSQELTDFLNSEVGSRLLDRRETSHPTRSLSAAAAAGIISLFVGFAFMLLVAFDKDPSGGNLMVPGLLFVMAGIGILLSAVISARLFRRAGLLPDRKP
jgi:hypothetical protein